MKVDLSSLARRLISLVMVLSFLLTACASNTSLPTSTSTSVPPPTQTLTSTPEPTPTPSIAPPDAQGSALDQALLDETWNSDHIQAQKTQWEAWIHYWLNATNPPIVTDIKELRYALLTDPSDPPQGGDDPRLNEKAVLILTWRDPSDTTKTIRAFFPVNTVDGGFQIEPPPVETPYEIEKGTEPFFLPTEADRPLVWRGMGFARLDPVTGLAREVLSKTGEWVPAYGVSVIRPEMYTPEQQGLLSQTPEVQKEGMPLSKCFVEGAFAQMFYCGSGNEVKAVYDQETDQVHPAMMMNSGKMLVVNERGMHEMKLNPLTPDAADVVHILPEYWRKKVCDPKMSMPASLTEVDMGANGKDCCVILHTEMDADFKVTPRLMFVMSADLPVMLNFVDVLPDGGYVLSRQADNGLEMGYRFGVSERGHLELIYFRDRGLGTTSLGSQLAMDIYQPLGSFWGRSVNLGSGLVPEPFFAKYFLNNRGFRAGRNFVLDSPVPVIYGQQLKVIR